ncbi:magnesium transporter NIPA3 isoform X2 [Hyalella azteca]|uniref:Magnesium transporter NIPA3 isoform X2 n=1 Tax=Hyalella azteca TaxID=294128 RepID=A0A979FN19_HYAAZ|nr:magnesium transporter NIPA3 isoform X2 [Hyalella azteca]
MTVFIGIVISLVCQLISGISISIRKKALKNVAMMGGRPASEGGLGHLKSGLWWTGLILMFAAQGAVGISLIFAPAVVVAPLAVLSIAGAVIGGRLIMKEKLCVFGWMGCIMVMTSCAIFSICAPSEIDLKDAEEFDNLFKSISFISYTSTVTISSLLTIILAKKFNSSHFLIYSPVVGGIASLSVWLSKGFLVCATNGVFNIWSMWVALGIFVAMTLLGLYAMHVTLHVYDSSQISAMNYVIFSTLTILCSTVLFPIKIVLQVRDAFLMGLSFMGIIVGLFVMIVGKKMPLSFKDIVLKKNEEETNHSSRSITTSNEDIISQAATDVA